MHIWFQLIFIKFSMCQSSVINFNWNWPRAQFAKKPKRTKWNFRCLQRISVFTTIQVKMTTVVLSANYYWCLTFYRRIWPYSALDQWSRLFHCHMTKYGKVKGLKTELQDLWTSLFRREKMGTVWKLKHLQLERYLKCIWRNIMDAFPF